LVTRDLDAVRARCVDTMEGDTFYGQCWRAGEHELGPSFRTIMRLWRRDGEALAEQDSCFSGCTGSCLL
jgi:hypothetical protein